MLPEEWPRPEAWNQSSPDCIFTIKVPFDEKIELLASASNGFDKWTESNLIEIDAIPDPERLKEEMYQEQLKAQEEAQKEAWEESQEESQKEDQEQYEEGQYQEIHLDEEELNEGGNHADKNLVQITVIITLLIVCIIFISFFMARAIFLLARGNKKR